MHLCSLISTFVLHFLDGIISVVAISEILRLLIAVVAEQAGFSLTGSQMPKDMFYRGVAHMFSNDKNVKEFVSMSK